MPIIAERPVVARGYVKPFLAGVVVVALAIAGMALLSEAFASGGQTVYLANIEPGGKEFPTQPSIVVTGSGGAAAPAEEAVVQFLIVRAAAFSRGFAEGTPAAGAPDDTGSILPVTDAIRTAGVAEHAIRVVSSPSLISVCTNSAKCSAVLIEATLDRPDLGQINAIVNAAGEAAGEQELTVQDVGVGYRVADCRRLRDEARLAAAADGRARAEAQAKALGVALGTLVVSSETAPPEPEDGSGCTPARGTNGDAWWTPGSVGLTVPSFDPQAAPDVVVGLQVTLAYAIGEAP